MIELVLRGRPRDIGGFDVRRSLPAAQRRLVGPFIFFDHMGPAALPPGAGIDVRPHPHICLATVTYLFEGELVHKDSLGSDQPIRPGDVNWMTAGRGIVHSERSSPEARAKGVRMHGIQLWVALPKDAEEIEPTFRHHPGATIPSVTLPGARLRVVLGRAYGATSPVEVLSPTFYVEARLEAGAELAVPTDHEERAVYVVDGVVRVGDEEFDAGHMIVLLPHAPGAIAAKTAAHVMLLGGAPLDGARHIEWNFVASSKERIEKAKDDWRSGRFPKVPGDELEHIPLPEPTRGASFVP